MAYAAAAVPCLQPTLAATLLLSWWLQPTTLLVPKHNSSSSSSTGPTRTAAISNGTSQHNTAQLGSSSKPGTVMVTGGKMTKALHVCRHLAAAGWRVVLVETHKYWHVGSRFSSSVASFHTVPVPEDHPEAYVQALLGIAAAEGVTMFIPVSSPIASLYDALAGEALAAQAQAQGRQCRSWSLPAATTALLDHKGSFSAHAAALELLVPQHHVVTSPQQLQQLNSEKALGAGRRFVLKSIAYDSVHRADLMLLPCSAAKLAAYLARPDISITQQCPWILQEYIQGREYSCYSLAHLGRLVAHADTAAALSNLNYKYEGHPAIRQWVEAFVQRTNASGQLCFDFIESAKDGRLYCIECNPRTSSVITEFHDSSQLAAAFASPADVHQTINPLPHSCPIYWWWNEVARLAASPWWYAPTFLSVIGAGVDGVFTPADPWPFIALHYLQVPALLVGNMLRGNPWKKVDLCIGKVAELYGD